MPGDSTDWLYRVSFRLMSEPIKVMAVVGSLHENSVTKVVINHVAEGLREAGCEVDLLDLADEKLPLGRFSFPSCPNP